MEDFCSGCYIHNKKSKLLLDSGVLSFKIIKKNLDCFFEFDIFYILCNMAS